MQITLDRFTLNFSTPDGEGSLVADLPGTVTFTLTLPSQPEPPNTEPEPPEGDWIDLAPGDDLQARVNDAGPGAHFRFAAGTYTRASILPRSDQFFDGQNCAAVFDGELVTQCAFYKGPPPCPSNVTIRGFEITRYFPKADDQAGAVLVGGHAPEDGSYGWIVEGCDIHHNEETGLRIGNECVIRGNRLHHNHRLNIGGSGNDAVVENNEISYGNWESRNDPGFEAGGTKFAMCRGLVVRGNDVHNNVGPALWADESVTDATFESNNVHDNWTEGICIEISYRCRILNNTITNNGWQDPHGRYSWLWNSAVGIHSSPDCEVAGNTVSGNWAGICVIQQDRTHNYVPEGESPHEVRNLNVHDNQITHFTVVVDGQKAVAAGLAQDCGYNQVYDEWNNRFTGNSYDYGNSSQQHEWNNGLCSPDQWRAYGQE
jgi:parallel beta-helix repeat protein